MKRNDVALLMALIVLTPHLNQWIAYLLAAGYVYLAVKVTD